MSNLAKIPSRKVKNPHTPTTQDARYQALYIHVNLRNTCNPERTGSILQTLPFLGTSHPQPSVSVLLPQNGLPLFYTHEISVSKYVKPLAFPISALPNPNLTNPLEQLESHTFGPSHHIKYTSALPSIFSPTSHSQRGLPPAYVQTSTTHTTNPSI